MALININCIAKGTQLGIWKKEEDLELLESVYELNKLEQVHYNKISNESRKKEWLSTRILLTELLQQRKTILYNENSKPYIENHDSNISISHSRNFVAIIISHDYFPGVDIEFISERVAKVKHKFLNSEELSWCTDLNQLTTCWSAKETVFKLHEKHLDFYDMLISKFEVDAGSGKFRTEVIKSGKESSYLVNYICIENDILTYTLSKSSINS
ncbi:MAG: 4'-phosphopantetheinyl transferase superfamily protein [Salinivirgaceae bacterium]|jgi:4'-phosphopantetheinyl transferase|nr:4'-phosphopantetheinyl transferase superfamily protein [Salinivirgaceae bacterium]